MISKLKNPYFISQIISAAIAVVLLPILTRIMPQEEIGYYAEIMSFAFFISVFIKFGSHQAVLVFLNDTSEKNQENLEFSRSFSLPFINFLIAVFILAILSFTNVTPWIYLIAGPYALVDILYSNRLNYLRYKDLKSKYLFNTVSLAFLTFVITTISVLILPTAESRLIAIISSFIIVNILFHRQAPKLILNKIFAKVSYFKYMKFGVWLALMWLIAEFFNWFIINQISQDLGLSLTGRFSVLKTIFYQSPAILISVFDLIFIDKYYKKGEEYFKKYISKYLILLVLSLLVIWIISSFIEKDILVILTGDLNYFRNDNWLNIFFGTLIFRSFIFKPLYQHYKNKQTYYVFLSYFLSYLFGLIFYFFFKFEITFSLLLIPMFLLNIFLRLFNYVKI